ncbi:MAG TPA: hypothetical protein VFH78_13340 [Candidatus Thermoplasmatota archaeon]|nr:hypothetical protein [Candidatus Thermoplasmatota archaeon]
MLRPLAVLLALLLLSPVVVAGATRSETRTWTVGGFLLTDLKDLGVDLGHGMVRFQTLSSDAWVRLEAREPSGAVVVPFRACQDVNANNAYCDAGDLDVFGCGAADITAAKGFVPGRVVHVYFTAFFFSHSCGFDAARATGTITATLHSG